jgi:hypothetical protein
LLLILLVIIPRLVGDPLLILNFPDRPPLEIEGPPKREIWGIVLEAAILNLPARVPGKTPVRTLLFPLLA